MDKTQFGVGGIESFTLDRATRAVHTLTGQLGPSRVLDQPVNAVQ